MYLLSNRFDTVMKYEAQRFEKNYAESSTLGINVSHSLPADVLWGSFVTHSFIPVGEK